MAWKILIADDHKVLREGLRTLLDQRDDMQVVGEAEDGRSAVALVKELAPHVVLLDISMPDMNGTEAAARISAESPGSKVIALSVHSDRRYVLGMLRAGAVGYLVKSCAFDELTKAIEVVCGGDTYLCPAVTGVVLDSVRGTRGERAGASPLSSREREVLQLIAEGVSTREIATRLNVSVKTVEGHRAQIMSKLDFHSVAELTKYAIREGLTSLDA